MTWAWCPGVDEVEVVDGVDGEGRARLQQGVLDRGLVVRAAGVDHANLLVVRFADLLAALGDVVLGARSYLRGTLRQLRFALPGGPGRLVLGHGEAGLDREVQQFA